jgi:hypothetical protein
MATSPNFPRKLIYLLMLAPLLGAVAFSQGLLNRQRGQLNVSYMEPIQNAPPLMRFASETLGGFRGVLSTVLWMRINQMQMDGKYFEMMQLSDWITKLQPHTPRVWTDRAWNLAYNISVKEKNPRERWKWVNAGISLLRDEAIQYNPHEPELYWELAWIFQHKMGQDMDVGHRRYKNQWINLMTDVLWPSLEDCLASDAHPDFESFIHPPQDDSEKSEEIRKRVHRLTREFKMDPRKMQQIDRELGTAMIPDLDGKMHPKYVGLEWRLPETHAIYWSWVGVQKCHHNTPRIDLVRKLRRLLFQSMLINYKRGRLVVDQYVPDWKERYRDGSNWVMYPRLESVEIVEKAYQTQLAWINAALASQNQDDEEVVRRMEELDLKLSEMAKRPQKVTDATLRTFENAHHNFYRKAVTDLYMHNRMAEANYYFNMLCKKYPEKMMLYIGFDKHTSTMDLDTFVTDRLLEDTKTGSRGQTLALLENLIVRAYISFSHGEDDSAKGGIRIAQRTHESYNRRKVGTEDDRVLLPSFLHIHDTALNRCLQMLTNADPLGGGPIKAANLRRRLGLEEGKEVKTNSLPKLINPFEEGEKKKNVTPGAGN